MGSKFCEKLRVLSEIELARLGQTISEMEAEGGKAGLDPFQAAAYRLLIFTGCRLSEIQTLKWEYVKGDMIELPESKTGARRIHLPPAARAVLAALPRDPGNPYVIQGSEPGGHITDLQRPWRRVRERDEMPEKQSLRWSIAPIVRSHNPVSKSAQSGRSAQDALNLPKIADYP